MNYLTTNEMDLKLNITRRRISTLCVSGRIDGAILKGKTRLIPEDVKKTEDPRKSNG